MKRNYRYIILSILVGLIVVAYWMLFADFSLKKDAYIYVDADDTADSVYVKLDRVAAPGHFLSFKALSAVMGYRKHIRHGRYTLTGVGTLQLFRNMRNGKQGSVAFVVPIVRTSNDLAGKLGQSFETDSATFARAFHDPAFCAKYGVDTATIIALFIPNTYELYWSTTPEQLMTRMKKEYDNYWTPKRKALAKKNGLTPLQVMTLASIVEQETNDNKEKPMVAGMYLNRYKKGMRLQADPTVKYATGKFYLHRIAGDILFTDSPYNTYKYAGLPPGPICIPSIASIKSVLNYAHHNYFYMCAKEDFSGSHNFAETYEEHQVNAKKYAAALNARGIK